MARVLYPQEHPQTTPAMFLTTPMSQTVLTMTWLVLLTILTTNKIIVINRLITKLITFTFQEKLPSSSETYQLWLSQHYLHHLLLLTVISCQYCQDLYAIRLQWTVLWGRAWTDWVGVGCWSCTRIVPATLQNTSSQTVLFSLFFCLTKCPSSAGSIVRY